MKTTIRQHLTHLTTLVAVAAAGFTVQPGLAAPQAVREIQLPTVVITAKRIPVIQLERVVITAKRNAPATTLVAQRPSATRT